MPIQGQAFQIDFEKEPDAVNKFLHEGKPLPKKHLLPVKLSMFREVWFGIGPMETKWNWEALFEKRLSFAIWGSEGGHRVHVSSYDPMIVHASKMHRGDGPHRLRWLHQFTLLPRCPRGEDLSFSVSPHIDTSEHVGSDDIQREHLEDRWLIALEPFSDHSLSVDDDIDAAKGQFFYERVDLASCTKYLDQVADPDNRSEFESECESVNLNERLWQREETEAWFQDFSIEGRPRMHVKAREGSVARAIEQNLLKNDIDRRLDTLLFEVVSERVEAASDYYRQVLQNRDDRIASLLNSWNEF
jgi:hypothetical protein